MFQVVSDSELSIGCTCVGDSDNPAQDVVLQRQSTLKGLHYLFQLTSDVTDDVTDNHGLTLAPVIAAKSASRMSRLPQSSDFTRTTSESRSA